MRLLLKPFAILLVKHLQRKYKRITVNNSSNQTNQILCTLQLIQSKLYYYKRQFSAWGYFHPSCVWSEKDELFFKKLFPVKDFEELEIVIWHNPEAVTYYHNKIYKLRKENNTNYTSEIETQLRNWKKWN
tara:strand:- start:438 stop:827 length:390 start_codon:yes stop_codon:yes gene_type:complete